MSYLPCELHCHTVHSDGDFQVRELLENAATEGLALIALTDHNTLSGHDELDDSVLPAIRGIEWTTYYGHMLVLGARKFIDWRDAVPTNIDEKIHAVKAAGGVVGIAHPFQIGSPVCTGGRWEFEVKNWDNVDYMEIWHEDLTTVSSENKKAFELDNKNADIAYYIAAILAEENDITNALSYANTALQLNSEHSNAKELKQNLETNQNAERLQTAINLYDSGKYDECLAQLNQIITGEPSNAYALYYRGMIYDTKKQYQNAINDYKKALEHNSELGIVNYLIAVDYDSLSQFKNAYTYYKTFVNSYAEDDDYKKYSQTRLEELKDYAK